ncbi:ATP-grasp domain-containing protein [Ardenticatena maritima]|uniref:ATPase n=2 Tax=Ardenticatena maritima TaxID=872965 RepID=A0A0P6YG98_9CHLR|nr:ATP-grasp domain-containing protein [Ardenticatena maritima]KPL89390.1 ATPase [Ardenticatena maritima]
MNQPTLLVLASYFKGEAFLEAAKEAGAYVIFITNEKLANKPWPHHAIDEFHLMPDIHKQPDITYAVAYLMRHHQIERIVPLDDFDVELAADLREHFRLNGLGCSQARYFRDKLAERILAREHGFFVPRFTPVFNDAAVQAFIEEVPPPWMLKPRSSAAAIGIRKIESPEQLWFALEDLGDERSFFLLEEFLHGDVHHVDALTADGNILFAKASRYGRPPFEVAHFGGVSTTTTLPDDHPDAQALLEWNRRWIAATQLRNGVTHTEFLKRRDDGNFYFIETAARVGGAHIVELLEAATNFNPWREWARLEVALARGEPYTLPALRNDHAALVICLARQQHPDLSAYNAPEVVWRAKEEYHAGVILASSDYERICRLRDEYADGFARDFLAVAPPPEKPTA